MPIYEFTCKSCGHEFEKLCRVDYNLKEIQCPKCGANDVRKRLSLFGYKGSSTGGSTGSGCSSCSSTSCSSCGH
ncbi:hypothetical protein BBF96_06785 [Anoxybacter fermentans]|uniref:Putative regulatory protein FmdB zinc ribbon domain-containing protein n=1 Tax=Anoxybacter fermentans TaxID=1323375 RepID=A0A3S9SXV2_9FIRM|nr:zinc ribbon domain-containing protein [Anoxybacter fermentans]AZR73115.1 hypothetical protein BBF96_06785 [Anoxybacter fermentans]